VKPTPNVEMNYCHRCGTKLHHKELSHVYECEQAHIVYANASPAAAVILMRSTGEALVMARAKAPGIGRLTIAGGFCNGAESMEDGVRREVLEETRITPEQYGSLHYVTSGLDIFIDAGERVPVSAVVYIAQLHDGVEPQLDEENLWYKFTPLMEIDADAFYSPTVQQAFRMVQADAALIPDASNGSA
jgi:ADP-ribose pyrophosphatase YjhB (NUDIX family)